MTGLRIAAIRLACQDVTATAAFWRDAFACGGRDADLLLGLQRVELVKASAAGQTLAASNSTAFQHCAIVVRDMRAAMAALAGIGSWTAISQAGPETLPAASGGVTAFKFRDPEGHPLELLQFPARGVPETWRADGSRLWLGIDHSAIAVADTARACAFYTGLGFSVFNRRVNQGREQSRLDGVAEAVVEVTGLAPPGAATPHLELLCYRHPAMLADIAKAGATTATRLILTGGAMPRDAPACAEAQPACRDPDGHILVFAED